MADVDVHPWEYWPAESHPGYWVFVPDGNGGGIVVGRVWSEPDQPDGEHWRGRIAGHRQVTIVGAARLEVAAAVVDGYDGLPARPEPFG